MIDGTSRELLSSKKISELRIWHRYPWYPPVPHPQHHPSHHHSAAQPLPFRFPSHPLPSRPPQCCDQFPRHAIHTPSAYPAITDISSILRPEYPPATPLSHPNRPPPLF